MAVRGMNKNKVISLITLFGLSIALTTCLLILFYISFELSHDRFHERKEQIYKVNYSFESPEREVNSSSLVHFSLAEAMKEEVPQVKLASPFRKGWAAIIKYNDRVYNCSRNLGIVESDFLQIFSFPVLAGYTENAFESPQDVVITKAFADKIIDPSSGNYADLIGKPIEFLNAEGVVYSIKAILDEIPKTSSIEFEILVSFDNQDHFAQSNNVFGNASLFVELLPEADPLDAEASTNILFKKAYEQVLESLRTRGYLSDSEESFKVNLQNITDIYLNGEYNQYESSGNKTNSVILFIIGLIVLMTACINYLLLSLGLTIKKTHQIGVLKVFGARQWHVLKQFWLEALMLSTGSVLIGLLLSRLLFPVFKQLAQRDFDISLINTWIILIFMVMVVLLVTGLIAGPLILFFRKVNPSSLLRKEVAVVRKPWISNLFVLIQYFIATVLIICTIVILKQTHLLKNKSLGFNPDQMIELSIPADFDQNRVDLLKTQLLSNPNILHIAGMDKGFTGNSSSRDIRTENQENYEVRIIRIDPDYLETMGIELLRGENFTLDNVSENNREIIVNQKFFETVNVEERIGITIEVVSWQIPLTIRGIIKDFHFDSMRDDIDPLILIPNTNYERIRYLYIKYPEGKEAEIMTFIEKTWNDLVPGRVLEMEFFADLLASRYEEEESWGRISTYASLLAILISSLGLFGLSLIMINKRIREIGIRKVHGASVRDIVLMLNRNFLLKILISFVIACPVAWYIMSKWLENFVYRTGFPIWIFLLAGAIVLVISLLTVNWQCVKAAHANPVDSIKYE